VGADGERVQVGGGGVVGAEGEEEGLVVGRRGREVEEEAVGGRERRGDEERERAEPHGRAARSRGREERDPRRGVMGPVLGRRHGVASSRRATRRWRREN